VENPGRETAALASGVFRSFKLGGWRASRQRLLAIEISRAPWGAVSAAAVMGTAVDATGRPP